MTYYFLQVYKCDPTDNRLNNGELMNICQDFCQFVMKEIIHFDGKYFDLESELAQPVPRSRRYCQTKAKPR